MEKELTIVIPVYNGEKIISELLASLFLTPLAGSEIIVVDDGSTDQTVACVSAYPVQLIRLDKNHGIAYARNRGLEQATTRYVAFVDADCIVPPGWSSSLCQAFKALQTQDTRVAALSGRVLPFTDRFIDRLAAYVEHAEYQGGPREERMKLSTSNCICDKSYVEQVGMFDESLVVDEDRELALRLISHGFKVMYVPTLLVYHRHNRHTLIKILRHHFQWGQHTGLKNEWRYRQIRKLWFLPWLRHPGIYLLALPFLCLALTGCTLATLIKEDQRVIWALPYIFIAKLFYRWGVFLWLVAHTRECR